MDGEWTRRWERLIDKADFIGEVLWRFFRLDKPIFDEIVEDQKREQFFDDVRQSSEDHFKQKKLQDEQKNEEPRNYMV